MTIRVCNLKKGERFKMFGLQYIIYKIDRWHFYYRDTRTFSSCGSFGLRCQMKVELILDKAL